MTLLPEPDSPTIADPFALGDVEVDAADGFERVVGLGAEADVQVADLEQRLGHASLSPAP